MAETRIINLPTATALTTSTYFAGDNMGSDGTVKFNYTLLGETLADTVYTDTMLTESELIELEQELGINS